MTEPTRCACCGRFTLASWLRSSADYIELQDKRTCECVDGVVTIQEAIPGWRAQRYAETNVDVP